MRAWIYDRFLLPITTDWYREVLDRLPKGSRLLDIGIGTGGALAGNAALVRDKGLHVTGIDIDADYVGKARKALAAVGLTDHTTVDLVSIYDFTGGPYDAAYFSASFMLMPDPPAALRHVFSLLEPGGRVYFTQTFQERRAPILERTKPLLKKVTTVDFGKVTYEPDFLEVVRGAGLEVTEMTTMSRSRSRSFRLVAGRQAAQAAAGELG